MVAASSVQAATERIGASVFVLKLKHVTLMLTSLFVIKHIYWEELHGDGHFNL